MEVPGVAEARVSSKGCLQRERDALLLYKAAIEDPSGRLSSWRDQEGEDCCAWAGVVCYNTTGGSVRVAELNLQNPIDDQTNWTENNWREKLAIFAEGEGCGQTNWTEYTLRGELLHPSLLSLSHLQILILSFNDFNGTQIPPLIGSLRKLRYLDLYQSNIGGIIPPHLGNLTNLRYLHLSQSYPNSATGVVDSLDWLSGLSSNLIYLGMSYLDLSAASHNWISAVNMLPSLQHLYLYDCRINIPLSLSFHLNLTSLVALDLGGNIFDYSSFPNWLWNLTTLSFLRLDGSGIRGALPNEIGNLIGLTFLDLSSNLLSGPFPDVIMNLSSLSILWLYNCSLTGSIPSELGNLTTLNSIFLSHNSLSGPIPIEIWKLVHLNALDLFSNKIRGTLPPTSLQNLTKLYYLNLHSNRLQGLIPHLPPNLKILVLSNNAFSGSIQSDVCNSYKLEHLHISENQISGEIPRCWRKNSLLEYMHLGNNMLFGEIPSSLGNLMRLKYLHLNNNNLKGHLPSSLQKCTRLSVVDLGDNKFSGNIPMWIEQSWHSLRILRLSSNMFDGNINPRLGYLRNIQIIDLANNKLSGPIPHSFGNFSTMISTSTQSLSLFEDIVVLVNKFFFSWEYIVVTTKGNQFTFSSILYLMKSIDLSNNSLTGEIPEELGYLTGLNTLNLSRNYFRGKIPDSIGEMSSLETLDLSFNNLSGHIPQSLSQLNALDHLNMSYNNLFGSIPTGHQLQTLDDPSIYVGNSYLCGDIVNKSCFRENNINVTSEEHAKSSPMSSIYFSCTLGYLGGLWSVFILVLFKKKWRYSYFKKIDEIYDKVYVIIKIRLNRIVSG